MCSHCTFWLWSHDLSMHTVTLPANASPIHTDRSIWRGGGNHKETCSLLQLDQTGLLILHRRGTIRCSFCHFVQSQWEIKILTFVSWLCVNSERAGQKPSKMYYILVIHGNELQAAPNKACFNFWLSDATQKLGHCILGSNLTVCTQCWGGIQCLGCTTDTLKNRHSI